MGVAIAAGAMCRLQVYTFKPGEMGITYDDNGFVEEVRPYSQAGAQRILKGYQIVKVGTEEYSKYALAETEKSGAAYEITFKVGLVSMLCHWISRKNAHESAR